ncbi:hypothetical protein ACFYZ5_45500 [Streptomyces chartreusis]|uniref:hypothetical protein n=1 Tax=Streptomyces chartreusis TaxID=1969 RepID=UPI00367D81B3
MELDQPGIGCYRFSQRNPLVPTLRHLSEPWVFVHRLAVTRGNVAESLRECMVRGHAVPQRLIVVVALIVGAFLVGPVFAQEGCGDDPVRGYVAASGGCPPRGRAG